MQKMIKRKGSGMLGCVQLYRGEKRGRREKEGVSRSREVTVRVIWIALKTVDIEMSFTGLSKEQFFYLSIVPKPKIMIHTRQFILFRTCRRAVSRDTAHQSYHIIIFRLVRNKYYWTILKFIQPDSSRWLVEPPPSGHCTGPTGQSVPEVLTRGLASRIFVKFDRIETTSGRPEDPAKGGAW